MAPGACEGGRGEATLWEAVPNTAAENEALVEQFRAGREEAYEALIGAAERLGRKAALGPDAAALLDELEKLEREFRAERRRDYFRSPLRAVAAGALRQARKTLREAASPADAERGEGS